MNLSNLITEAQRLAGRVDTDFNDRTRRWLNEAQTQWAIAIPWASLARRETFAMNGGQQLVLPPRVLTVKWLIDRTNHRPLYPNDQLDKEFPWTLIDSTAGNLQAWKEVGVQPVSRQPSAQGTLSIQTTASDNFNVFVAGLVENTTQSGTPEQFYAVQETVVVSDSAAHTTANQYVRVEVLGKDKFSAGDVIVKDAAANQLARIPYAILQSKYRVLEFVNTPSAGTLIDVFYIQEPLTLVDNAQHPPTAVETDYLLWYTAGMIHAAQGQDEQSQAKLAKAAQILQARIVKDRKHGDKDWRAIPDPFYWANEDQYEIPNNYTWYGW